MGGSKLVVGLGALTFAALLGLFLLFRPDGAQAIAQAGSSGATYVGVASCSGTTCHGRSEGDGPVVRQDEIMLWQDPASAAGAHSRANNVLREPRSQVIAQRLGIGEASSAPMCLGCHATPAGPRGARFQASDGVGCESCHGPASGWVSSHYAVGGTHAQFSRGLEFEDPGGRGRNLPRLPLRRALRQFVTHRPGRRPSTHRSSSTCSRRLQQHHQKTVTTATGAGSTRSGCGRSARRWRSSAR
jgi:hypothetical protein